MRRGKYCDDAAEREERLDELCFRGDAFSRRVGAVIMSQRGNFLTGDEDPVRLHEVLMALALHLAVDYGFGDAGAAILGLDIALRGGPSWLRDNAISPADARRILRSVGAIIPIDDDPRQIAIEFPEPDDIWDPVIATVGRAD